MADDYEVGYGKPPKKHQFKPGQSGNRNGRPKGMKNLKTDIAEEASEMIEIKENGRHRKVSKQRAMIKSLYAKAIKGDVRASEQLIKYSKEYQETDTETGSEGGLGIDDHEIIENFIKRLRNKNQTEGDR